MLFPSRVCVCFTAFLACIIGSNALVIHVETPDGIFFNCSLMEQEGRREIPAGYTDLGVGVYKYYKTPVRWGQAMEVCEGEGAHLVIINSQEEEDVLMSNYRTSYTHWSISVGLHDFFIEGQFRTVQGKPLESTGYVHWGPKQPDGGTKENIVVMREDGTLHDYPHQKSFSYICEFERSI